MGGGQALTTGLTTLDRFAWIGAFSAGVVEPFQTSFGNLAAFVPLLFQPSKGAGTAARRD
jgi:enterochelin esterase-like enzyme